MSLVSASSRHSSFPVPYVRSLFRLLAPDSTSHPLTRARNCNPFPNLSSLFVPFHTCRTSPTQASPSLCMLMPFLRNLSFPCFSSLGHSDAYLCYLTLGNPFHTLHTSCAPSHMSHTILHCTASSVSCYTSGTYYIFLSLSFSVCSVSLVQL